MTYESHLITDIFYYLLATSILVPLFRAIKLDATLGYLFAGIVLGPNGLKILKNSNEIQDMSEIGIIFLLFVTGLELTPNRLEKLKNAILKDGVFQFLVTGFAFSLTFKFLNFSWPETIIFSTALTISSTAFCLNALKDTQSLTKSYGQSSFGILILQDLVVVPLLAIIPLMANSNNIKFEYNSVVKSISLIFGLYLFAKFALRPFINYIHKTQPKEIFTISCLTIIFGSAIIMNEIGLSKALGAFLVGIYFSNIEIKKDVLAITSPIKSILMGIIFMTFGLQINKEFFASHIGEILLTTVGFMGLKLSILALQGRVIHKSFKKGLKMGLFLNQGGEFSLIVISLYKMNFTHNLYLTDLIFNSIVLSITLAPLIIKLNNFLDDQNEVKIADVRFAEVKQIDQSLEEANIIPISSMNVKEHAIKDKTDDTQSDDNIKKAS